MRKTRYVAMLAAFATLVGMVLPAAPAMAAIAVGPIDPASVWPLAPAGIETGFPAWYSDAAGAKLALMPITGNGRIAPTQVFLAPDPLNPYSVFLGFDSSASYFNAQATIVTPNGRLTYTASLDAAFPSAKGVPGTATPGQEIVTETISVKMPLVAGQEGAYTIQDPYGSNVVTVTAADIAAGKGLNFTLTVPALPSPRAFGAALAGPITAFLRPANAPPPGWLGDGVTIGAVTGSPTGFNQVIVNGPAGKFITDKFTISGRLFDQVAPVANFILSAAAGKAPFTVDFTDTSSGPPSSWSWNFGDGSPLSHLQNPSHTYLTAGSFDVVETVANAAGTASVSHAVTVSPATPGVPVAGFTATPRTGPAPLTVAFTDMTAGVPTSWSWNFGDGSALSTLQNPSHSYSAVGNFTVTETAANSFGTSTATQVVVVTGIAAATLPAAPTSLAAKAASSTQVDITWVDNANNEGLFMITRARDAAFTTGLFELHPPASLAPAPSTVTFSDITVVAGATYFYKVMAGNTLGNSAPSNVVTVTTPAAGAPVPPTATAGAGGEASAALPPPLVTPMALSGLLSSTGLSLTANGEVAADSQVKTADDGVVITLAAGTSVTDADGNLIVSLSASANPGAPAPPQGGVVLSDFIIGPSDAQFDPPGGLAMRFDPATVPSASSPDKLYIGLFDAQNKKWVKLNTTLDGEGGMVATRITRLGEFAVIADTTSGSSPPAPATPPAGPPSAPTVPDRVVQPVAPGNLIGSADADGLIHLSWTMPSNSNENGFMIERAADAEFTSDLMEYHVPALTATFTDTTAAPGTTYYYRVEAVHSVGHSAPTNVVSLTASAAPKSPASGLLPPTGQGSTSSLILGAAALVAVAVLAIFFAIRKKAHA